MKYAVLLFALALAGIFGEAGAEDAKPKHDTRLPIEISSDTLEVLQHENKAIFRGNVVAVQGDMRLKSDVMIVHYKQQSDGKTATPAASPTPVVAGKASPDAAMGAITLIEVQGNVFVATPEESAKGDRGDYHVDTRLLHLFGDNVTLTRDKNILKGKALEYNLDTGRSVLTDGATATTTGGNSTGGRVRGVFVPSQDKPGGEKK